MGRQFEQVTLEWARERATWEYKGLSMQLDSYWSKDYVGQKMFTTGRGPYLRGPADDIMRRH